MDQSRLSNIVAAARVVEHFTPEHTEMIKSCIFKELKCQNESDFICKALYAMYKSLSFESTVTIKNTAIQLAEAHVQVIKHNTDIHIDGDIKQTDTEHRLQDTLLTINKYIEEKYTDPFSKLGSDIIDYIGAFLTRKESIVLGHSNKQLFIETQKDCYLLKRFNDELELDGTKMTKMIETHSDGYNFCFCSNLHVTFKKNNNYRHQIHKIACYNNFFGRLRGLSCNVISLSYVPIDLLFNFEGDYKNDNQIQRLTIDGDLSDMNEQDITSAMQVFCARYDQISEEHKKLGGDCESWCGNINTITFGIVGRDRKHCREDRKILQQLVTRLGYLGRSIVFSKNIKLDIRTRKDLESVFHSKLQHISFLSLSCGLKVASKVENTKVDVPMLHQISVVSRYHEYYIKYRTFQDYEIECTLNCMDGFSLRTNIICYNIYWKTLSDDDQNNIYIPTDGNNPLGCSSYTFNRIFFQDYDQHPLLNKITIKMKDDRYMSYFARLLVYFYRHYKQLFVQRKLNLSNFEKIEIEFDNIVDRIGELELDPEMHRDDAFLYTTIFKQSKNENYCVDENVITIDQVQQNIVSFGIIHANVVNWLQRKQARYPGVDIITGCKVVFITK